MRDEEPSPKINSYPSHETDKHRQDFRGYSICAGGATGISLRTQGGPFATISIAAFILTGVIGTHSVNVTGLGPAIDISSLFDNAQIAHFSMTTTSGGHRPYILDFTPTCASVPD